MSLSVYVAGSSDEMPRVRRAMERVRAAGMTVAHDWVLSIEDAGGIANDEHAESWARRALAKECLYAVARANALWLLAPETGHGRGAFVELGYALSFDRMDYRVIVSGRRHACSIFTALGIEVVEDDRALDCLIAFRGFIR